MNRLIATLFAWVLTLTGCAVPSDPPEPKLGLSLFGTSLVVWVPKCGSDDLVTSEVWDLGTVTRQDAKPIWHAQFVKGTDGTTGQMLDKTNRSLLQVRGDYDALTSVQVTVETTSNQTFVGNAQKSQLSVSGVLLDGEMLTPEAWRARARLQCRPAT